MHRRPSHRASFQGAKGGAASPFSNWPSNTEPSASRSMPSPSCGKAAAHNCCDRCYDRASPRELAKRSLCKRDQAAIGMRLPVPLQLATLEISKVIPCDNTPRAGGIESLSDARRMRRAEVDQRRRNAARMHAAKDGRPMRFRSTRPALRVGQARAKARPVVRAKARRRSPASRCATHPARCEKPLAAIRASTFASVTKRRWVTHGQRPSEHIGVWLPTPPLSQNDDPKRHMIRLR